MLLEPLYNFIEICARQQIVDFVISPGSRSAALTIAIARHPQLKKYMVSDERSAAFIALGLAQAYQWQRQLHPDQPQPLVGLLCTSGSAVLNYAPAIAEAFYQRIPLLVLTADRPPEWINQLDGQAIQQGEIFGKHVAGFFQLPVEYTHPDAIWQIERQANEAVLLASQTQQPVHINIPIREPFYPTEQEEIRFPAKPCLVHKITAQHTIDRATRNLLLDQWDAAVHKLIVVGQGHWSPKLRQALIDLQQDFNVPVVGDVTAQIFQLPQGIGTHDLFLPTLTEAHQAALQPDLLITFGQSILSKPLKQWLRKCAPKAHWHIQAEGSLADPFQSLTHWIPTTPDYFLSQLFSDLDFQHLTDAEQEDETGYFETWQHWHQKAVRHVQQFDFSSSAFAEIEAVKLIFEQMPVFCSLHLANSMPVRYANYWGLWLDRQVEVFSNRGTSGIDGCLSTAVGAALAQPDRLVVLLIGDLAFFYDRNGLWNNFLPANLRVIVLNNHAGNIFRMIEGAKDQPELETYFETQQPYRAKRTAEDAQMAYFEADNPTALLALLPDFFAPKSQAALLEIETSPQQNAAVLAQFKKSFLV